jgi:hypothetical protein
MTDAEKTGIAAHLYVSLRRSANRVIDVEWMSRNEEYAREVIQLARQQGSDELKHYADRYEELMLGTAAPVPVPTPLKPAVVETRSDIGNMPVFDEAAEEDMPSTASRYIGALR